MRSCKRFFAVALVLIVIGFLFGISFPAVGAEKDQGTDKPIIISKPLKYALKSTPVESAVAKPAEAKPTSMESTTTKSTNVKRSGAKHSAVKPALVEPAAETAPVKQPPANCKYTTTLDKPSQVVYVPAGKECEELLKDFTSQSKSCCVCAKDSSAPTLICKGACCPVMFDKVGIKR